MSNISATSITTQSANLSRRPPSDDSHVVRYTLAFGRTFVLLVRGPDAQFEVSAEASHEQSHGSGSAQHESTIRLCVAMGKGLEDIFRQMKDKFETEGYAPRLIPIDDSSEDPNVSSPPIDLSLSLVDGQVTFDDLTSPGILHGFRRLPYTTSPELDSLYSIISAATHWYYHLRRKPAQRTVTLDEKVTLEFVEMGVPDDRGSVKPRLVLQPQRRIEDSIHTSKFKDVPAYVEVEADSDTMYGNYISNTSEYALYPALFFFDNSDLSISPYYIPPSSTSINVHSPPLRQNGSLGIGLGSNDSAARVFYLPQDKDLDIGYLKLFLTTKYTDFSHIEQVSPFESRWTDMRSIPGGSLDGRSGQPRKMRSAIWDEITLTIVQRIRGSGAHRMGYPPSAEMLNPHPHHHCENCR